MRNLLTLATVSAALLLSEQSMAASLDAGFGSGGRQVVNSFPGYAWADAVATRSDGRIVASGYAGGSATARFMPNGALDTTFGGTGTRLDTIVGSYGFRGALALQADDKIIVGGSYMTNPNPPIGFTSPTAPYLLQYNPDGSRDSAFGASGVVLAYDTYGEAATAGLIVQPDGKIVVVTVRFSSPVRGYIGRHNADGSVDGSFAQGAFPDYFRPAGVARQVDGKIVVFGAREPNFPAPREIGFIRHSADGARELVALQGTGDPSFEVLAGAVQPDGKVLVAGGRGVESIVMRFLPTGALDTAFAAGGVLRASESSWISVAVQPDGRILLQSPVEVRRLLASGAPDETFGIRGRFGLEASAMALQPDGKIVAAGSVGDYQSGTRMMVARVDPGATPILAVDPPVLHFGTRPSNTAATLALAISNPQATSVTVSGITAATPYSVTHDCGTLPAAASCTALVTFAPTTSGTPNPSVVLATSKGAFEVPTRGAGEDSLTRHFYRSILRREGDSVGVAYWERIRIDFLLDLMVGYHEAWFGMATSFFGSAEYKAFGRDDTEFLRDLYRTFFDREMDEAGRTYWAGQLSSGLPRDAVVVDFMLSTEFDSFMTRVLRKFEVPAHKQTVLDFYRGFLARVPDTDGFKYWATRFRTALCSGAGAVAPMAEAISASFAQSAEYAGRNRTNSQFVADLYNAFMRRGGDLEGIRYWTGRLDDGATREELRQQFRASPEFGARVSAMVAQGCPQ